MTNFEQVGTAMLLAEEGKREMARQAAAWLAARFARIATWLRGGLNAAPGVR